MTATPALELAPSPVEVMSSVLTAGGLTDETQHVAAQTLLGKITDAASGMLSAAVAMIELRLTIKHNGKPDKYGQSPEYRTALRAVMTAAFGNEAGSKERKAAFGSTVRNYLPEASQMVPAFGSKWSPPKRKQRDGDGTGEIKSPTAEQYQDARTIIKRAAESGSVKVKDGGLAAPTAYQHLDAAFDAVRQAILLPLNSGDDERILQVATYATALLILSDQPTDVSGAAQAIADGILASRADSAASEADAS